MEADESLVEGVSAPGDSSSAIADVVIVEEVSPTAESSAVVEPPPIPDDAPAATQAAEEFPASAEIAVPQEGPDHSLEFGGAAVEEETPGETVVEETEPVVEAPVQEFSANEAEPPVEIYAEPEAQEQPTTQHASFVEGSSADEIGVEESMATGEAPVDDEAIIVEERGQEAPAVESESAVEVVMEKSVGPGMPEAQEAAADEGAVSEESSAEPPIDAARETYASEDMPLPVEATVLEAPSVAVEPEAEVPPAEPTSEEPSEQPILPSSEESPIQLESEETPLVEPQPATEEPHEEPAIETMLSQEIPSAESELPVEEAEVALDEGPTEILHVTEEPDPTNEAPLAKEEEAAVVDVSEREAIFSTSEITGAGEASIPEGETPLEQQVEGSLEPAIPTAEAAPLEDVPVFEPPPIAEAPEEESLGEGAPNADEVTTTFGDMAVAEDTSVVVEAGSGVEAEAVPERIAETTEIKESDADPENATASVPEISEDQWPKKPSSHRRRTGSICYRRPSLW
jgi:ribonuclease E